MKNLFICILLSFSFLLTTSCKRADVEGKYVIYQKIDEGRLTKHFRVISGGKDTLMVEDISNEFFWNHNVGDTIDIYRDYFWGFYSADQFIAKF